MNLPTVERHYLTKDGDMVDEICWRYYGFTNFSTEAVYVRNPFLSLEQPILPPMLLIVLPVLTEADLGQGRVYWPVKERKLYTPGGVPVSTDENTPLTSDGCCADNPEVVESAEWVAVYVPNALGDWVLRRIHHSKLCAYDSGGYAGALTLTDTVEDPSLFL